MSVIVMGMDMPTVCVTDDGWYGNCPMDRVWCAMRFKPEYEEGQRIIDEITGKRPDWCPIRPLPEKHGRLIDAKVFDAAFTALRFNDDGTLRHWDDRKNWCLHGGEVESLIENTETIVEAEGD